jgi:signal transduction histidine kinase
LWLATTGPVVSLLDSGGRPARISPVTTRARAVLALGAGSAFALLLSPAVLGDAAGDVVLPSVLPLGFFAAGAVAQVLRPGHRVGERLLAVGVLHLLAFVAACAVALDPGQALAAALAVAGSLAFALGFVVLLDLLARYPTGEHAWAWVAGAVRVAAAAAVVLTGLAVLGGERLPSPLGLASGPNPLHVAALGAAGSAIAALALLPVLGFGLLVARYRGAPEADREQMRWPIATASIVVVGLLTAAAAEEALGPDVQAALFLTAGAALPLSFLVGILRHAEAAERLAAVEESRARLAEAADAERRRIERDLHDGAQQSVLALLAQVELTRAEAAGRDEAVAGQLRQIGDGLRRVHAELRELARGVHPAVLTDHGLPEAVRSALSRLPLATELKVSPAVEAARYPRSVEAAAYFLTLEGLTNAIKHGAPSGASVAFEQRDDVLEVTVRDDGRGFTPPAPSGGGLLGLSDRLAAVGGRLEVESRPGRGTTLRGVLPVRGRG